MAWFEGLYTEKFIDLCGFGDSKQTGIEAGFVAKALGLTPDSNLLDRNGFDLVDTWGDFDGSPYSVFSRRLIAFSRKRD